MQGGGEEFRVIAGRKGGVRVIAGRRGRSLGSLQGGGEELGSWQGGGEEFRVIAGRRGGV